MRARGPVGILTLLQQAIAAIKRNNGTLFYVPANFAGAWTDSAGTDPVNEIADVIGRMTDRTGGTGVATQATTENKPTVQVNAQGLCVMRFDGSNDSLTTNITTGNKGWVCAGVTKTSGTTNQTLFINGAVDRSTKGIWLVWVQNDATWRMFLSDGSGVSRQRCNVPATTAGVPAVIGAGWDGATVITAANGSESSYAQTNNPTHTNPIMLGGGMDNAWLNGSVSAQVICPVLPSAADRALIRKWIGSLQGQSL